MKRIGGRLAAIALPLAGAASLTGCLVGPNYKRPDAPVAVAYKELKDWAPAVPADAQDRGDWWRVYDDPLLDSLERQIDITNQNLKSYEAAYRAAQAAVAYARSALYPTVTATPGYERTGQKSRYIGTQSLEGQASWAPDIWGRVRRQIEAQVASAQVSAAQLASIRLSAQTDLALDYFELRYEDSLQALLDQTVAAYRRSVEITQNQYEVGVAARSDVITAETQLFNAEAQAAGVGSQRAQYEHAIALLIGKPPAELTIKPAPLAENVPETPVGLPSALLQRRPDIAEAERRLQQENALIGVAIAAYYPSITLSATGGLTASALGQLANASSEVWTLAASGSELLFDGGSRAALVAEARATYEQNIADYRQTVLAAFQNVEDQLAVLRILGQQAQIEVRAVQSARRAEEIAVNEYRAGTQAYTTVVTAQTTALQTEETALQVQENRMKASVSLIAALGGGWTTAQLPGAAEVGD